MAQMKYEFKLKKMAMIQTQQGPVPIGECSNYEEDKDGNVKVTIDFMEGLPKELMDSAVKNPRFLSVGAIAHGASNVIFIPDIIIPVSNNGRH